MGRQWLEAGDTVMPEPQYLSTDPNAGQPMRQTARQQADASPGQYANELLRNVPADLIKQATNVATGTVDLLSVLAKATSELGVGAGNFIRETVGLEPHGGGSENIDALAGVPRAVASHYGQYLDPEARAARVRDEPVGMALDMMPVAGALKSGVPAAVSGVRRGASAVGSAPGRVLDAAIGMYRGSPTAAMSGMAGRGPVESVRRMVATPAASVSPAVSPPAASATAAPSASPATASAPRAGSGPSWLKPGEVISPQRIQNELGIQARRQKVTLTEPQYKAATEMVAQGSSPAEAVADVARRTAAPSAASAAPAAATPSTPAVPSKANGTSRAKLTADEADEYLRLLEKGKTHEEAVAALMQQRQLAAKPGTLTPEAMRREIAERKHNRSPQR